VVVCAIRTSFARCGDNATRVPVLQRRFTVGPAQHDLLELNASEECVFDPDHLYHDHESVELVEDSCERCTHGLFCPIHDKAGR
jgi:hypothetical protein